jgi:hypothetical protein
MGAGQTTRHVAPYGDVGPLVDFHGGDAEARGRGAQQLANLVRGTSPRSLVDVVANFVSDCTSLGPLRARLVIAGHGW